MAQSPVQSTIDVPISRISHQITLRVSGLKSFGVRMRIAGWLFVLGAKIAGLGIVLDRSENR